MRAFVTGGTGFIGSHLVDRLLEDEQTESVHCLIRNDEKWLSGKPVTPVKGNLHDLEALKKGMDQCDTVFHLAALTAAPDQQTFHAANVDATENVIRIARKKGVKKLVILSSLAATGPSFGRPVTEEDPLMPVSMYGQSKKAMEEMVHRTCDDAMSVTIIKPPAVYGPREEQIYQIFKAAENRIFPVIGSSKSVQISLVHVRDVIQGIMRAAGHTEPGVSTYFISSEDLYTWEQVRLAIAGVLGKKVFPIRLPVKLVKHSAALIEATSSVFGRYPVINRDKAKELTMEWTCSVAKAKQELQFSQSVDLYKGIAETIDWYKRHKWL